MAWHWTIIFNWTPETNFSEIWTIIPNFSFSKMHLKMLFAKWQSFLFFLTYKDIIAIGICKSFWQIVWKEMCILLLKNGVDSFMVHPLEPNAHESSPGAHFTNDILITTQNHQKIQFVLTQILIIWSLLNFAHGMTAVLSWHMQKFSAV